MADVFQELQRLAGLSGPGNHRTLSRSDFTAGSQTASVWSQVSYYQVPPASLLAIPADHPFHLKLRGHAYFASATGGTPQTFDLTGSGFTGITDGAVGDSDNVKVYDETTTSIVATTSITYASASVSADITAGDNIDVFAYPVEGEMQLRAIPPQSGNKGNYNIVYQSPIAILDSVNQANAYYAPKLRAPLGVFIFGPMWTFEVWAKSAVLIDWVQYGVELKMDSKLYQTDPNTTPDLTRFILDTFYPQ